MFNATFLGHHGWLFESEQARVLVDPLLRERFGHTDAQQLLVFPPRELDLEAFPAVDALLLTHEHEGHFDLPSIAMLDRRIPVYMSSRSSAAMHQILCDMGFEVRPLVAGAVVRVGDLEILPITCDQIAAHIEEWDVLAYVIRDVDGDGSFFTAVDMPPTEAMWRAAKEFVRAPGLWAYTNNTHQEAYAYGWDCTDRYRIRRQVAHIVGAHRKLREGWAAPTATLVIGGGFCFGRDQAWMNRNSFPVAFDDVVRALDLLHPPETFLAPRPGQRFGLLGNALATVDAAVEFCRTLPVSEHPSRAYEPDVDWIESFTPGCGRTSIAESEVEALQRELDGFAGYLYGSRLFRELYSLTDAGLHGKKPTFAIVAWDGQPGEGYVFEYRPQQCCFLAVESRDPAAEYLAVYECWASDLLAHFRCEVSVNTLAFGRQRHRSADPIALAFDLSHPLFNYAHPLRFPERYLEFYRATLVRTDGSGRSSAQVRCNRP